jgi:hypothetical protein
VAEVQLEEGTVRSSVRRAQAVFAGLALTGFCLAAAPRQGRLVVEVLRFSYEHVTDPLPVARRVIYGPRFVRGIDAIAAVIPPGGSYWLVDGNEDPAEGYFVRSALAPRQARYLGRVQSIDQVGLERVLSERPAPFVVLAQSGELPTLVDPHRFLKGPGTR